MMLSCRPFLRSLTGAAGPLTEDDAEPRRLAQEAAQLERAGRLAAAAAVYERLLARWPDRPTCWYNLAVLQRRTRRYEEALHSYQQALARGIDRAEEVHLNRGVIYADHLRRDDAALAELQAALALNPGYVPALLNLANLHEDLGRKDEAIAIYERVLALDPQCTVALARHAMLAVSDTADSALVDRLRQAVGREGLAAADRAVLGFALGTVLDRAGAYDAAFEAFSDANAQSRASVGTSRPLYDRAAHERLVAESIRVFDTPRTVATPSAPGPQPIFICGMFRSGSTLVEQILGAHPDVTAGGELDILPQAVRAELSPYPAAITRMPASQLASLAVRYREALARLYPHARRVTDKRPGNFLYIGVIKTLFPDARIVHTYRNALDNCLSIYFLHLDPRMGYALDLGDIGHYYRQYRRLMAHWRSLYGSDILDFDYDALVREPQAAIGRLLGFLGLPWDDRCLEFHRQPGAVKTASVWQVRRPLYRSSSGRARHYARQLAPLRQSLQDLL